MKDLHMYRNLYLFMVQELIYIISLETLTLETEQC